MYNANEERYNNTNYKICKGSGLKFPPISLGLWMNFGERADMQRMKSIIFTAFDNGITHFDLANNYGPPAGVAEQNFGRIIASDLKQYRDELLISTKAGYRLHPGPYGDGGSRKFMMSSLDSSLKRMGLEYVDIFYHHRMDKETPLEETMLALDSIVKSGKATYIGLSNYDTPTMLEASKILKELHCPFIINQNRLNIFDRTIIKNGFFDAIESEKKGLIVFSPLAQGMLSGRYLENIPEDSRIRTDGRFLKESSLTPERLASLNALNDIAKERGQTLAQMALSWIYRFPEVTSILIGASKPEQVLENIKMTENCDFTEEELRRIDACLDI